MCTAYGNIYGFLDIVFSVDRKKAYREYLRTQSELLWHH